MLADASPQVGLWAALSAPACGAYAAVAAGRATQAEAVTATNVPAIKAALIVALVVMAASWSGYGLAALIFASGFTYLAVFDLRVMAVPVWPVLALIAMGLLCAGFDAAGVRAFAAVIGWTGFTGLAWMYRALRGREGLGEGDALLAALLGAWLSFEGLVWSVALGGFLGIAFVVLRPDFGRAPMPFAPALAIGAAIFLVGQGLLP